MKNMFIVGIVTLSLINCNNKSEVIKTEKENMKLVTQEDSVSYGLGINIAENLTQQGFKNLNIDALAKGMQDIINQGDLLLQKEEAMQIINAYVQEMQKAQYASIIAEGENFLAENGKREGVVTLPSGLQYEIIEEGTGATPTAADQVTTHYTGTLMDGRVFDSSVQRGEPATFPVGGVIKGWTEALQLMKEGGKWKLYIPYNLAYGDRAASELIGPYSTLIFDIELIKVN